MTSCSQISSEIAALRADIAALDGKFASKSDLDKYIPKNDRPNIIQSSVMEANDFIVPGIMAAIGIAINGLKPDIQNAVNIANSALSKAGDALGKAGTALSQITGLAAQIVSLAATVATLLVLGARIDAVEKAVDFATQYASDAYALGGVAKKIGQQALDGANHALDVANGAVSRAVQALDASRNANRNSEEAKVIARDAKSEASKAISIAIPAKDKAELADKKADMAIARTDELAKIVNSRLGELSKRINDVGATASAALDTAKKAINQAQSALAKVTDLQGTVLSVIGRLKKIEGVIPVIQGKLSSLEGSIGGINSKIKSLEGEIEGLKTRIENILGSIPNIINSTVPPIILNIAPPIVQGLIPTAINNAIPNIINQTINYITSNTTNITNIFNSMSDIDLRRLENKIDAIPSAMIAAYIASPAVFTRNVAASATGTCQTMQPGGCSDNAMRRNNGDLFNRMAGLFNSGANAAQLALLNIINSKLGQQINNAAGAAIGIGGAILRLGQYSVVDRFLNLLTFAATVHNATQLSSNIAITLIQTMQNVLDTFGLKDANGESYSLSQLIGNSIENFLKSVLGASTVESFKTTWAQYSRIYQAGANLFSSLMSMGDSITQGLQVIGAQTGKIGNALRAWGVVSEKAYSWMNPTPNFSNPLLTKLNSLEETASMVENVSQQPLNVKLAKEELEASSKALADSLEQKGEAPQSPPIPEALKVKEEQTEIKTSSAGKDLADSDLEPDE